MKNRFGKRYITDKEFLDYAWDTDLFTNHPSRGLLEFLERRGILNPVARIRFPPACVRRWYQELWPTDTVPEPIEGDTTRLEAASALYNSIWNNVWQQPQIYGETMHPLDEPAPADAPFVQTAFSPESFVPWYEFNVAIALRDGNEIHDGGQYSRTFYHYWQIFALAAFMRSGLKILFDLGNDELFRELWELRISDDMRPGLYATINLEAHHELNRIMDHANLFEAVTYFETYRKNALQLHIHDVDRESGRLPSHLSRQYRGRERELARQTLERYALRPAQILDFIKFQAELWCEAKRRSPEKITTEYRRNIASTVDLYRLVSRKKVDDIIERVGRAGGYFKPILKVIFPDWLDEQRDLAQRSLRSWILPTLTTLPPPYAVTEQDISAFCDWLEAHGLYQLYWHFKRLLDLGFGDAPITRAVVASEVVSYANTVELLANAIVEARGHAPRGKTLNPKLHIILAPHDPTLSQRLGQFRYLTVTRQSTLNLRLSQIDRISRGGAQAEILRVFLKLLVIRNEGTHLGLRGLDRKAIYDLLKALIQATVLMWMLR